MTGGGPSVSVSDGEPDPEACRGEGDLGKLHHNAKDDVWYEGSFDPRRSVYTWAILPPTDEPPRPPR